MIIKTIKIGYSSEMRKTIIQDSIDILIFLIDTIDIVIKLFLSTNGELLTE